MNHFSKSLFKKIYLLVLLLCFATISFSQHKHFTKQDTLRGSITPERAWWDLTYYHLDIKVDPEKQTINGTNTVQYRVLNTGNMMQIDLQEPMKISKVEQAGNSLEFTRDGNVFLIKMVVIGLEANQLIAAKSNCNVF